MQFIDMPNPHGVVACPQARELASYLYEKYNIKEFIGTAYRNGHSEHEKGLALDIILWHFPFAARGKNAQQAQTIVDDIITKTANLNIEYVVWNNTVATAPNWNWQTNIKDTRRRTQSELHTNHIHVTFAAQN